MSQYKMTSNVRSTHNRDGAIVLDLAKGEMFSLNVVGSRILEMIKTGAPANETAIIECISKEFAISREMATQDVRAFLHSLVQSRLIDTTSVD